MWNHKRWASLSTISNAVGPMHARTHACMHACMCMHVHACMHTYMHASMHARHPTPTKTGLAMHTIAFLLLGWPTMIPTRSICTQWRTKDGSDQSPNTEPSHGATLQKRRGGRARTSLQLHRPTTFTERACCKPSLLPSTLQCYSHNQNDMGI